MHEFEHIINWVPLHGQYLEFFGVPAIAGTKRCTQRVCFRCFPFAIGISWFMPMYEGGDSVSKYSIQWDTNSNFGPTAQTAIFSNLTSGSPYSYVIGGLTTNTNYFIRVLSYNSYGYGPPAHAFVPNDHSEIQVITLTASSFIQQGQFRLSYTPSNVYGSLRTQYTDVLNYDADAATMAEAINSLKSAVGSSNT